MHFLLSLLAPFALAAPAAPLSVPISFAGTAGNVSGYSRAVNYATCAAAGRDAEWVGTPLGVKRINKGTGQIRFYGAADGLPWARVTAIATDDAGVGAVALLAPPAGETTTTAQLLCLYDERADRWRVIDRLPPIPDSYYAGLEPNTRDALTGKTDPTYRIALTEKTVVVAAYVPFQEPSALLTRYRRGSGERAAPIPALPYRVPGVPPLCVHDLLRRGDTVYLATNAGLLAADIAAGTVARYLPAAEIFALASAANAPADALIWTLGTGGANDYALRSFSPASHTTSSPVAHGNLCLNRWSYGDFCVGDAGTLYFVQGDYMDRYTPSRNEWTRLSRVGDPADVFGRPFFRHEGNDLSVSSAGKLPDAVALIYATKPVRDQNVFFYDDRYDPFSWIHYRFSRWISDAGGAGDTARRIAALPPYDDSDRYAHDPAAPDRAWRVANGSDTTPARLVAVAASDRNGDTVPTEKVVCSLQFAARRGTIAVTGLTPIWEKVRFGEREHELLVDTNCGTFLISDLYHGSMRGRWITPAERAALIAGDDKTYRDRSSRTRLLPDEAQSRLPQVGLLPDAHLRMLGSQLGGIYYMLADGYPNLLVYEDSQKTWTKKSVLTPSARRLWGTGQGRHGAPEPWGDEFVVGDANGLWRYDREGDRWKEVRLPASFVATDPAHALPASNFYWRNVAADRDALFVAGRGENNDDPPILARFDRATRRTTFLTEENSGIGRMHGHTPALRTAAGVVWATFDTPAADARGGGAYRYDTPARRFVRVSDAAIVAVAGGATVSNDIYLLTPKTLQRYRNGRLTIGTLPLPPGDDARALTVAGGTVYIASHDYLLAWDARTQKCAVAGTLPPVSDSVQVYVAPSAGGLGGAREVWVYDAVTMARVMIVGGRPVPQRRVNSRGVAFTSPVSASEGRPAKPPRFVPART